LVAVKIDSSKTNYVLLLAMNTIYTGLCGMWVTYFPLFVREYLKLDPEIIGVLYTLSSIAAMVGSVVGGFIADAVGRRPCIALGYTVSLLALASMLLSNTILMCASFVLYFLGVGMLSPAVAALILESSPQRIQGTLYMLASRVAPSIPPLATLPAAGYLYEKGMYRVTIVIGILSIVLLVVMTLLLREPAPSRSGRTVVEAVKRLKGFVLRDRVFLLLVLAFGLDMLTVEGLEWYIPIYLKKVGFTAVEYGLTMGLASLAVAVGALASGGMVDRLGPRYASAIGWASAAAISALFVFTPSLSLIMLFMWRIAGLLPRAVPPVVIARRYRETKATALSAFNASLTLISLAGPVIVGISASTNPALPFVLRATALLLSIVIIWIGTSKELKQEWGTNITSSL